MGLASAFSSLTRGNFTDAFNYAWVPESEIARSNALDSRLEAFIAQDQARGIIDAEQASEAYGRIAANAFRPGGIFDQPGTSPAAGFAEGLREGADNIRGTVGGAINSALTMTARLIPWQIWAILIVAGVIYFWPVIRPLLSRFGPK